MSHTPGPWKADTAHPYKAQVRDESGLLLAECDTKNARLIALAPEMLEVVRGASLQDCVGRCYPERLCFSCKAVAILKKLEARPE